MDYYTCRRCVPNQHFGSIDILRGHLRSQHNIGQLIEADIPLYEAFPGSHNVARANVDPMIHLRGDIARIINGSIARHIGNNLAPQAADLSPIIAAINQLRSELVKVQNSLNVNTVVGVLNNLNGQIQQLPTVSASLHEEIQALRQDVRNFQPVVLETPVQLRMQPITSLIRSMHVQYGQEIHKHAQHGLKLAISSLYDQLNISKTSAADGNSPTKTGTQESLSVSQVMDELVRYKPKSCLIVPFH